MPHQTLGAVVGVGAENCVESFQVDCLKMVFKMIFKVDFQNRLSVLILIEGLQLALQVGFSSLAFKLIFKMEFPC